MLSPRFRLAAVPVFALVLAACQDRAGPLSPDDVRPRASVVATVCDAAADARAHALINLIYPEGKARDLAHERFNKGRQAAEKGRLTESWSIYAPLLADIAARANAAPAGSPLRAYANELASLILVCSRQPGVPPELLGLLNLPEEERVVRDVAFTTVSPTTNLVLSTPKRHFALTAPANFFDETGLLVVSRISDDETFGVFGVDEHPPRYNVTLFPYTAQANFDNVGPASFGPEDVLNTGVFGDVAICPGLGHPETAEGLRILRRAEPFLDEPTAFLTPSSSAIEHVNCASGHVPFLATAATGADRVLAGMQEAGARLASLLLPRLAYAVDGGIGGRTRLYSDYVAARPTQPSEGEAQFVDRILFTLTVGEMLDTVTQLPLAPNPTEVVTAVPQRLEEGEYVDVSGPIACTWTSSQPTDIVVAGVSTSTLTATLTRSFSFGGAAKVTAVCNGMADELQILPGTAQPGPS